METEQAVTKIGINRINTTHYITQGRQTKKIAVRH